MASGSLQNKESLNSNGSHGPLTTGKGVKFDASPLYLASMVGDRDSMALLLKAGANPNHVMKLLGQFPTSLLVQAAEFGDPAVVNMVLAGGANINVRDPDRMTALHWAALAHRTAAVKVLLAGGADVNAVDRFGYTPLQYAATVDFGDAAVVKQLLAAGANPNLKDKHGKTAAEQSRDVPYLHDALKNAGEKL